MARRTVLLTGASGFIGRRLQAFLLNDGWNVRALLRPDSRHSEHIDPACSLIRADLDDRDALREACSGADAVIYSAGAVRGRCPDDFRAANVDGVAHLAGVLNRQKPGIPLLLVSSLAAARPDLSDYAHSKHLGEQVLMSGAGFPWTIFRPPAVYGPGDQALLPLLRAARRGLVIRTGPPNQRLSFLYVDDLARAALAWLDHVENCTNRCFTLDDGRPGGYDWSAIARAATGGRALELGIPRVLLTAVASVNHAVAGIFGYAPMLTPGKARELTQQDWLCHNNALTEATGWQPETDLAAGISKLFDQT